ncbi:MAG: UDP-N-acetylmuramyl pentapeptide phosphotransferase/UDP-N-acetylglucosamine-1-phosphate transferase [Saprospiraceae bacterium]|jgi:UDP-N-acetylmuramyl pentapeptide phosphotransferase/UDP-N-acetylglucosamine-1-phosphate transferase
MEINWLSLVLATLVPTVVGFIYYHTALFGKAWMASIGMTEEKARSGNMPVMMGVSLVMSFLIAFFLLGFNNGLGQEAEFDTFKHGATHGVIISLFFVIPIMITNGLFEQRSWKNMLINAGYWIITLAIMGAIVDGMNHFPNVAPVG